MGTGYTRNDTGNNIADGNVINASDLDGEFDAIQSAFNGSSGHSHDGTTGEGPQIATAGIADANVTTAKLADDAVTPAKLQDSGTFRVGQMNAGGDGSTAGTTIKDAKVEIRSGSSAVPAIDLYCEVSNAHKVTIKSPPHADYSGDVTFQLPSSNGSSGQFLQTNGSGILSYATVNTDLSNDTSPQLGGNLDLNSNNITGTGGIPAGNLTGTVANARLDAQLQDVAGLAVTDGNFIVGNGSNFVAESGSTARTSLGLGTAAVLNTGISTNNVAKFAAGVADNDFLRVDGTVIEGRSASEVLSDIGAAPSAGNSSIVTTGALNSGSITSGFGSIDTGSSTIFTTGKLGHDSTDYIQWTGNTRLDFFVNNANDMRLESDGDLHVEGDVIAFSTTIASDPRLKENVEQVTDAVAKVEQLTGYTFDYKHGGASAGVMSTDVAQVLPSAVTQTTLPLKTGDEETEYDVVAYDQLHALLIEAVKELSARVRELENGANG